MLKQYYRRRRKITFIFLSEKVDRQGKINTLDDKIQDFQIYVNVSMDYKNELLIEIDTLIFNRSKSNLKNPSTLTQ